MQISNAISWMLVLVSSGGVMVSSAAAQTPAPPSGLYAGSPYLGVLRNTVVYGEIWERPQLSKRDRSLITPLRYCRH